jgi:hypothetical protein
VLDLVFHLLHVSDRFEYLEGHEIHGWVPDIKVFDKEGGTAQTTGLYHPFLDDAPEVLLRQIRLVVFCLVPQGLEMSQQDGHNL